MTGKTHRAGGALCAIVGMQLASKNNLIDANINPLIQFALVYPFAIWGSVAPDLDHNWDSCPSKTPVDYAINKALHLFNKPVEITDKVGVTDEESIWSKIFTAKHRSWQTHSDLSLFLMCLLLHLVIGGTFFNFNYVETSILRLILTGVIIGVLAHYIFDMFTVEGIISIPLSLLRYLFKKISKGKKAEFKFVNIRFVPKREFFTTTNESYEKTFKQVIVLSTYIYIVVCVAIYFLGVDKLKDVVTMLISTISN